MALKIVDDMLIQGPTEEITLARYELVLERCRKNGIKRPRPKWRWEQVSNLLDSWSLPISPDPAKLQAISEFPTPKSITELRSFLGLANQLGAFMPDLAHATVNMRQLLRKGNAFLWLPEHQVEIDAARSLFCSSSVVKPFDLALTTELPTNASRLHGLGFALVQRKYDRRPRLIQCAIVP